VSARARALALATLIALTSGGCATIGASGSGAGTASRTEEADVFALFSSADRAYRESRWIDAARGYQRLTERVPDDAYAWFRLGNVHARQGAYDRAIHAYEASIARDAEQPKPWFNLSTAHLLNAQATMARAWERLRPGDPARRMIERRLEGLRALTHDRIEESTEGGPGGRFAARAESGAAELPSDTAEVK